VVAVVTVRAPSPATSWTSSTAPPRSARSRWARRSTATFVVRDLNEELASIDQISVKTGADITGKAEVVYEYHVHHDAARRLK
jgi:hypothetical protein